METPISRPPFWQALIAEAKRRARQRRLLLVLLFVVVAGVTAALTLRPSSGAPRSGGPSARLGAGTSASPHDVHFGAFVLTVPKGIPYYVAPPREEGPGRPSVILASRANDLQGIYTMSSRYPTNGVALSIANYGNMPPITAARLPFDLHKFSPVGGYGDGSAWAGFFSPSGKTGSSGAYSITVWEGGKASAADRAAIERALRSIRRAR